MKKGFTLIELLAVIVILAIIAVIAVPIVLNIIDETKENATLRSAEMYVKAVELSIAQSILKNINIPDEEYTIKDGDICLNDGCTDKLDVEVNGKVPESGTITITKGNISGLELKYEEKTIVKNMEGKLVYQVGETIEKGKLSSVCKPSEEQLYASSPLQAGYKYECKVDPNKEAYTFYVLTTPSSTDTTINLIMNQNIKRDGTPAGLDGLDYVGEDYNNCRTSWNESGDGNDGPILVMQFVYNATKNWTNVEPLNFSYNDNKYTSISSTNGMAVIYPFDNEDRYSSNNGQVTIGTKEIPLRARLPIYIKEGDQTLNEVSDKTESNAYLYDNLSTNYEYYHSYTTLTLHYGSAYSVCGDYQSMCASEPQCTTCGALGIRPVITLDL